MTADASRSRRPTIYDVATRAGVSKSLVSLVLTNSASVRPAKRAAVLAAIQELGYRPSRAATTLASRETKSIGLVIDDYRNLWFVGLLRGMQQELGPLGYQVTVADSAEEVVAGEGTVERLLSMHIAGLVIAMEPRESMLHTPWTPTVVAGWRDKIPEASDLIANDDEAGGRLAANTLLELGHTKIGHLTGSGGAAAHRRSGFHTRTAEAGIPLRLWGMGHGTTEEDGYQAAVALLEHFPDTTAIFAANDTMAVGALAAIKARGLSVPGDISVLGYDNSPLAKSRYLDITSIDDKSEEVGLLTAQALMSRIADPGRPPQRTLVQPAIVSRGTTAPLAP
ncbi:LacI family DNA-binding transcriptional regulator [Pseudarthrobacter sp. AG30]|uniref:LacI family DNA-binding transcriptional regulator n=1 Tax=Pseudarthrobacter sp. AG30 TaxID=2249742 RepID=UPI000D64B1B6|nr:LacI family DNA-binding transcriptional regulator [Pseudarthrobacter sp. AG30]RAX16354.1 LacI family DNA-binding transcriptional regulator [Pseudarthrobacter sp. AG30]